MTPESIPDMYSQPAFQDALDAALHGILAEHEEKAGDRAEALRQRHLSEEFQLALAERVKEYMRARLPKVSEGEVPGRCRRIAGGLMQMAYAEERGRIAAGQARAGGAR